jgi:CheY-like chemotaxis protein
MHDMDGWTALRSFKSDPDLAGIPIVMVTVLDEKQKGFALGATDYLTKPIDRAKLTTILRTFKTPEALRRALIVEDDVTTREMLRRVLVADGWEVGEAGNGREALDRLESEPAQLILLDLLMPEMDGFAFLAALRAKPEFTITPIIVITAADLSDEDRRKLSGAVEHILQKSAFGREELLLQIRQLVRQYATAVVSNTMDA